MKAYYPSLRLTLWTPFSTPVEPCRRHTRYGSNKLTNYMYMYRNIVCLLYTLSTGSLWIVDFRMEVHSRVEFQNGSAFLSGISEWKYIPEWKFRMEVHSRMEIQNGSAFQSGNSEWKCIPEWNIYMKLNGPYGFPYICMDPVHYCDKNHLAVLAFHGASWKFVYYAWSQLGLKGVFLIDIG